LVHANNVAGQAERTNQPDSDCSADSPALRAQAEILTASKTSRQLEINSGGDCFAA
jgi:hypothetical protein